MSEHDATLLTVFKVGGLEEGNMTLKVNGQSPCQYTLTKEFLYLFGPVACSCRTTVSAMNTGLHQPPWQKIVQSLV